MSILTPTLRTINNKVINFIKQAKQFVSQLNVIKIIKKNQYEILVPFNLWFECPDYQISDIYENNQHIRVRIYANSMLTPLIRNDNLQLLSIRSFLEELSLYQPFYPETFYEMWEFLRMEHLDHEIKFFLHIGHENTLGSIEALVFYNERYRTHYQKNQYDCWYTGYQINYDYSMDCYYFQQPAINYLNQAYRIKFLKSSNEFRKYDFINIDVNHKMENLLDWSKEEQHLHENLFCFLTALSLLKKDGALMIKLNLLSKSHGWSLIYDIAITFFKEYTFIRPTICNPLNPAIYLFLNKFQPNKKIFSVENIFYKNLYCHQMYQLYFLNYTYDKTNPIIILYTKYLTQWMDTFVQNINNNKNIILHDNNNCVHHWHKSNDLKQIKEMNTLFNDSSSIKSLIVLNKNISIRPIPPDMLYNISFYELLIEKRAELNYHKRVMDTKPSKIFIYGPYEFNANNKLITWEQLTNRIDIPQRVRFILKDKFDAEMTTNAFIKMYEILNLLPKLLPINQSKIKTFHLCEAPGAFIAATNHYLANKKIELEWYAQTLNPLSGPNKTNTTALQDHFGLISQYPHKWLFGIDNSGDITKSTVIKSYASNILLENIDLITSDAGIYCHPVDLNEQESFLAKLNMGQIVCVLACLPINKSAILKTFLPMSEPLTISLIYLLTHLFNEINIIKPSTSHSYNSEIYISLHQYKGIDKHQLNILYALLDDPKITSKTLLFNHFDSNFFKSYISTITFFIDRQISSLCRNYYYYYHYDQIDSLNHSVNEYIDKWLRNNPISPLDYKRKLLSKKE